MLQTDRLTSLGTMAARMAHEINNPLAYLTASGPAKPWPPAPSLRARTVMLWPEDETDGWTDLPFAHVAKPLDPAVAASAFAPRLDRERRARPSRVSGGSRTASWPSCRRAVMIGP